eukprot:TRINITY_DN9953_c0_g2_i1.p1 TRINITY_DN9953_c0_g2~~TRINITY_DN9953_c0_g2_i1.p1  ORF type:complete len:523 (+),score=44.60 TRINITY_DN9953_c0_g2_i1:587-2155(+)
MSFMLTLNRTTSSWSTSLPLPALSSWPTLATPCLPLTRRWARTTTPLTCSRLCIGPLRWVGVMERQRIDRRASACAYDHVYERATMCPCALVYMYCRMVKLSVGHSDYCFYICIRCLTLVHNQVMLGIPFGMEIDVWSAGCVVAELYTNVPFFSGASPPEVMESILATFPQLPQPYANGKFYGKYASKIELEDSGDLLDLDQRHARLTSAVLTRLGSRDHVFGSFVAGLLDPNPSLRLTPMDALAHPFLAHQVTVHPDRPLAWRPSRRSSWRHCQHDPDRLRQRWSLRWVPGDDARGGASPPPVTRRGKSSVSLSSGRHGSVKLQPQGMADTGSRRLSNSNGKGFVTIAQQPPSSTLAARATTIKEEPIASPLPAQQTHAQALDRHDATGISHPAEASIERSHSKLQTPSHRRDEIKDGADHDPSTAAVTNNQQTKPKTAQAKPRRKAGSRKLKTQAVKQDPNGSRPRRARQPRVSDDVRYSAQHVLQAKRAKHMSDAIDINSTDDLDDDDDDDDDDPLLIM